MGDVGVPGKKGRWEQVEPADDDGIGGVAEKRLSFRYRLNSFSPIETAAYILRRDS